MFPAFIVFFKGLILGMSVSAPPGPNAMLMINRTLRKGHLSGFMTGMGVAVADTIFAVIAGLGFSYIITFVSQESFYIRLVAGIVVALIGIRIYFKNPVSDIRNRIRENLVNSPFQDFLSVFMLSLTNPFSIFIFLALFPGLKINFNGPGLMIPLIIMAGIFAGATLWWFSFSWAVNHFSRNMRLRSIVRLSRISGLVLVAIGVILLGTLFFSKNVI